MIVIAANAGGAWSPIGDVTTTMLWIGGQVTALGIVEALFLASAVNIIVPLVIVGVLLVCALLAVRRLEARFGEAERELRALRPRLERFGRVIDNVADWTDAAADQIPRVAADIETTLEQLRWVARLGAMVLVKPLRPLGAVLALWKGLTAGVNTYRQLGPARAQAPSPRIALP
jgi:hypothetical protein